MNSPLFRARALLATAITVLTVGCNGTADSSGQAQPPAAPVLSLVSPSSSATISPQITLGVSGILSAQGSAVTLYLDSACAIQLVRKDTSGAASSSLQLGVTIATPGTFGYSAKVTDGASLLSSPCSAPLVYTYLDPNIGPPQPPSSLQIFTPSASSGYLATPTVRIGGVTARADTVTLFLDSACTQFSASVASFGANTVDLDASALTTGAHTFYATASVGGLSSACSTASADYTLLSSPIPSGLSVYSPLSPPYYTDSPVINVAGVSAGLTVNVFSDAVCTVQVGTAVAADTTATVSTSGLASGTTHLHANSSNGVTTSSCSTATLAYLRQAPLVPSALSVGTPSSAPYYSTTPTIHVSGVALGLTVNLYSDACSTLVGTAAAQGSTVDITSSAVAPGTTTFYANSSVGSTFSACSSANVAYALATSPVPTSVTVITPASPPYYSTTPTIQVGGAGTGLTVTLYSDVGCSTALGNAVASGATVQITTSALAYGTTSLYAKSANGNSTSACSAALGTYNLQHIAAPTGLSLIVPSTSTSFYETPTIEVFGVASGYTVSIYTDNVCTQSVGSATATGATVNIQTSQLPQGAQSLYAASVHPLGSASACSVATLTYTVASRIGFSAAQNSTVGTAPIQIASGDFNEDGHVDLIVANYQSTSLSILKGNGNGTFQAAVSFGSSSASGYASAAVGYFNSDGHLDLAVTTAQSPPKVVIFLGKGDGTFTQGNTYATDTNSASEASRLIAADLDNDGNTDLAFANGSGGGSVSVLKGVGDGTFQAAAIYSPGLRFTSIAYADLNGDNFYDLIATHDSAVTVFINAGNGTFGHGTDYPLDAATASVAAADLNHDGFADIAVVSGINSFAILQGAGDGTLGTPAYYSSPDSWTETLALGDMDADGNTDVVLGYGVGTAVSVFFGKVDGTFGLNQDYLIPGAANFSSFVYVADFNGDGAPDIACTTLSGPTGQVSVLTNLKHP